MHFKAMPEFNKADIRRFWSYVEQTDPDSCWLWSLTKATGGYGRIKVARRNLSAHRVAYYLANKVDPCELLVCHSCDNPPCCNPAHLFLGDELANAQDMVAKGRHKCGIGAAHGSKTHPERFARGENVASAKLTDATARLVRDMYIEGHRQHEIAAQLGITREGVSQIVRGNNWRHVIRPDEPVCLSDVSRRVRFGTANSASKVTPEQVREIRALWDKRELTLRQIGERYGINRESVFNIVHRKTWREVT